MRLLILLLLFTGCSTAPRPSPVTAAKDEIIFIRCGQMIDGVADKPVKDVDFIVFNQRIEKVGRNLIVPDGAHIVDLSSFTVLPGLIDMHTHLTDSPEDYADLNTYIQKSQNQILESARAHAKTTLLAGFTTVRDVGTYHGWVNALLRDEINKNQTVGPRMQVAPFYLTIPNGGGDLAPPNFDPKNPQRFRLGVATTPLEFQKKAEDAVKGGADLLKVIASGAVLSAGGVPGKPEMTRQEIEAVVRVAHKAKIKVAAHAHGTQSILDALEAGVDTIEHASLIDEKGLRFAKKHHVALSMDIYNGDYIDTEGRRLKWPPEFLIKNAEITEKQRENFTKAYKAGVPLVFGTDAGVFPHGQNAKQFKIMVQRGMNPMAAIKSATSVAARYMNWDHEVGALTTGHYADFIAVEGDPLKNISILENVKRVYKGGRLIQ